jgi:anaerobic selenocysteine-containing dehydrogenase
VGASLSWERFEDLLYEGARGLYDAGRGYVVAAHTEESLRKILERQGYWTPEFESYDDFWEALGRRGAWWDPTGLPLSRKALLRTSTGKFEFYALGLKRLWEGAVRGEAKRETVARALGRREADDLTFLPAVAIPPAEEPGSFPLRLNTYRLMSRPIGGGSNQPWLLEQPAVHVRASWEGWVEIHPKTAAALEVKGGDWVWVESAKGRIRLKAKLYPGTLPDVIHVPLFGGEGPNPNDLIASELDPFRGFGLLNTTRVRIMKA